MTYASAPPDGPPGPPDGPADDPARVRRRPGRAWVLSVVGVVVVLIGLATAWAAVAGVRAKDGLEQVRRDLTQVRDHPTDRADVVRRLRTDAAKAGQARDQLHQLGPAVVARVPFLGRSMVAERTIADAATAVLSAAQAAADASDGIGGQGSGVDLTRLGHLHDVLMAGARSTAAPLRRLNRLDTHLTPGVVGTAVHQAQRQIGGLSTSFDHVAGVTDAVGDLLGSHGPRTIYFGLENNAELRGSGGLISTYALAHSAGGHLTVEEFTDSQGISKKAERAVTVPAPADYIASYGGYLANTTLWLNATMDPHVPATASVLAALSRQSLGVTPDAVLLLDVAGMASIVSATGPLHLSDGSVLSGDQLVHQLLVTQYGDGSLDQTAQDERHARLAAAASSGFAALTSHESDLDVLKALATAASGRHLALWSSAPAVQAELDVGGVSGSITPAGTDIGLVTVNNLGDSPSSGNKLDYYATRSLDVKVTVGEKSADVTQTLTMTNHAPPGLGPYVEGPAHPGRMHLLVGLAAAPAAQLGTATAAGKPFPVTVQHLAGTTQVVFPVDLRPGESGSWQLRYSLPVVKGRYVLRLLPQPLASPAHLTVEVSAADGSHLGTVTGDEDGDWTTSHNLTVTLRHPSWWHRKLSF